MSMNPQHLDTLAGGGLRCPRFNPQSHRRAANKTELTVRTIKKIKKSVKEKDRQNCLKIAKFCPKKYAKQLAFKFK